MGEPHVISALVAKRAELAGQMVDLDRQKAAVKAQLRHVDHTLAIFGYADPPRDIPPKRPHVYRFKRRELPKFIRQIEAEESGQTNRVIALRVMELKDWDAGDRELVRKVTESVKGAKNWQNRRARRYALPLPIPAP